MRESSPARQASMAAPKAGFYGGPVKIFKLGAGPTFALPFVLPKSFLWSLGTSREHTTANAASPKPNFLTMHPQPLPFPFVWQNEADSQFHRSKQEPPQPLGPNT